MIDEPFRAWLARAASAPVRGMHAAGITPNAVTVAAFVLSVAAVLPIARGEFALGIAFWLAGRLLDGYDGLLARVSGRTSLFGGFLDISLDMLAYAAMAVAFAWQMPANHVLWMFVLVGYIGVITTTLALSSLLERADRHLGGNRSLQFTPGLAEGGETTIAYVLVALMPAWTRWVLTAWILLLTVTVLVRIRAAYRLLL